MNFAYLPASGRVNDHHVALVHLHRAGQSPQALLLFPTGSEASQDLKTLVSNRVG